MVTLMLGSPAVHAPALHATILHAQQARAATATPSSLVGRWRVVRGTVAAWTANDPAARKAADPKALLGATVRFSPSRVEGPIEFRCGNARYAATTVPADGLFQGNLPAPAARAAADVGLPAKGVRGVSLSCDRGVFEYHSADRTTVLIALDNVIWTLSRAPGALADSASPSGVVERFLEQHFAGEMAFDSLNVNSKRPRLTDALYRSSVRFLAKPVSPDEAPEMDGDPFTDTQEYPTRFAVGAAVVRDSSATVPVQFADAFSRRVLTYLLTRSGGGWRIADIRYNHGATLRAQLEGRR